LISLARLEVLLEQVLIKTVSSRSKLDLLYNKERAMKGKRKKRGEKEKKKREDGVRVVKRPESGWKVVG